MVFPGATILSFDGEALEPMAYRDTEHFRITRDFLEAPERFFRYLLDPETGE
jgi:predicted ATPase